MKAPILTLLTILLFTTMAIGQDDQRHPRVLELEDYYKNKANKILSNRFKEMPFLVTVRIDPLRRSNAESEYRPKNETLPYFELEYENIKDEWDDPTASLYSLTNRVKSAAVNVIIPESISEGEASEIREALIQDLRLIPGRDRVQLTRRKWGTGINLEQYALGIGLVIMAFLFGLFLIQRLSIGKLVKALSLIQEQTGSKSEQAKPAMPAMPVAAPQAPQPSQNNSGIGGGGDIRLSDSHKTRELFRDRLSDLLASNTFPSLTDMLLLDELRETDPGLLGAFLNELPLGDQRRIFSLSNEKDWFDAYVEPSTLDYKGLDLIEKISRHRPENINRDLEKLKIQVWRLGDQSPQFLREVDRDTAYAILGHMPKSISIQYARAAFPGAWGVLLDQKAEFKALSDEEIKECLDKAFALKPKNSMKELQDYIRDRDLLKYLKNASMQEEREIYTAAKGSFLEHLRPPFFRVLEADPTNLYLVFVTFSVDDWAVALFNIPRDERENIENMFSQKQKFLFLERLKQLDEAKPSKREIGAMREKIASVYYEMVRREELESEEMNREQAA